MNHQSTLLFLCFFSFFNSILSSQTCLPDGLYISTQAEINAFASNYPNCTEVLGNIIIKEQIMGNITSLEGLSALVSTGGLNIDYNANLLNLEGLENLTTVNGNLLIWDNINMTSIAELANLSSLSGFLYIQTNYELESLTGLENLTSIGGHLFISDNPSLTSLEGIHNIDPASITSTSSFNKDLEIFYNPELSICDQTNICDFLLLPGKTTKIFSNTPDCESVEAIQATCPIPIPACTSLNSPFDGEENVVITSPLSWDSIPFAIGYKVSIGTTSGGTDILMDKDVGNVTTYDPTVFPCGSEIFVTIIPYSESGDAMACAEELFITEQTIAMAGIDVETCYGDSVQLSGINSIGQNFLWTPQDELSDPNDDSPTFYTLESTQFTLSVSNNGRCSSYDSMFVKVNPLPQYQITTSNESGNDFEDGTAEVTAMGGSFNFTYSWSNGKSTSLIDSLVPGTYIVTVTDSLGCSAADSVLIEKYICPTITLKDSISNVSCYGLCDGAVTLNIEGGTEPYTYLWSNGTIVSQVENLCSDSILVKIVDDKNCSIHDTFSISQPDPLSIVLDTIIDASCFEDCDGYIAVTSSGGTGDHVYIWNSIESQSSLSNLCAGDYTIEIMDENNCMESDSFGVLQPSEIIVLLDSLNHISGDILGLIHIAVLNVEEYSFLWVGPDTFTSTTQNLENLTAEGCYTVTITNSFTGCAIDSVFCVDIVSATLDEEIKNIRIYPNPTRDIFYLDFDDLSNTKADIKIFNAVGNLIYNRVESIDKDKISLDLTQYAPGIHFVVVKYKNRKSIFKLVLL